MNFWNYKALAQRLHKGHIVKNEKIIYLILAIILVLLDFFLIVIPLIGVLVYYARASKGEKESINRLKTKEFLSVLACLFVPVSIRNLVYSWSLISLIYMLITLFGLRLLEGPSSPVYYFFILLLLLFFLSFFLVVFLYVYDMYRALRTFSRLKVQAQKNKENPEVKKEDS